MVAGRAERMTYNGAITILSGQASVRPIGDAINLMYIGLFSLGART